MDSRFTVGSPLPASIGLCADAYHEVRELRLAMQKQVDDVQRREAEIREHIINTLSKSDDTGAAGLRYRAQIKMKVSYKAADWEKVWGFVQKTGRFDILQKRLGETAVADTYAAGETIPGVERVNVPELSVTKI